MRVVALAVLLATQAAERRAVPSKVHVEPLMRRYILGLEGSGTRMVARAIANKLARDGVAMSLNGVWDGERPPCWRRLIGAQSAVMPEGSNTKGVPFETVEHISLPWGLPCGSPILTIPFVDMCRPSTLPRRGRAGGGFLEPAPAQRPTELPPAHPDAHTPGVPINRAQNSALLRERHGDTPAQPAEPRDRDDSRVGVHNCFDHPDTLSELPQTCHQGVSPRQAPRAPRARGGAQTNHGGTNGHIAMALGVLLEAHVQVYAAAATVRPSASAGALARRQLALAAGEPAFPKLHAGRRIVTPPIGRTACVTQGCALVGIVGLWHAMHILASRNVQT